MTETKIYFVKLVPQFINADRATIAILQELMLDEAITCSKVLEYIPLPGSEELENLQAKTTFRLYQA